MPDEAKRMVAVEAAKSRRTVGFGAQRVIAASLIERPLGLRNRVSRQPFGPISGGKRALSGRRGRGKAVRS
jgi:hypothetical protein